MAKDTEQKKPNLFLRILILAMTAALMLGALFLVVNRDTYLPAMPERGTTLCPASSTMKRSPRWKIRCSPPPTRPA